jgi:hypothetical protein
MDIGAHRSAGELDPRQSPTSADGGAPRGGSRMPTTASAGPATAVCPWSQASAQLTLIGSLGC